jgi:hypothetical protein
MWSFLAYYRCTYEPNGFLDNSIALNFLNKALSIGLKNRELEAKAHFMGARCELIIQRTDFILMILCQKLTKKVIKRISAL